MFKNSQNSILLLAKSTFVMSHKKSHRSFLPVFIICCLYAIPASAIPPISEERGWSGDVVIGAGYTDIETNTFAGNDFIDGADKTIDSINQSPSSNDNFHPVIDFEVKYTFDNRNQIFAGSALEDRLTMDFANQLGWRKQTDTAGTIQLGMLLSLTPIELWEDPYLANSRRNETDLDTMGLRFEWDRVMGSGFGVLLQSREIDLDKELSGTDPALGCDLDCQGLLDRNGDQHRAQVYYTFVTSGGHILQPHLRFRHEDRDGDAIARDAWAAQLNYTFIQPGWILSANALYGESSYDERNPLYDRRQDAETVSIDINYIRDLVTESGRWQMIAGLFWGDSDSDIDFHDNQLTQVTLGLIYNFGNQE